MESFNFSYFDVEMINDISLVGFVLCLEILSVSFHWSPLSSDRPFSLSSLIFSSEFTKVPLK